MSHWRRFRCEFAPYHRHIAVAMIAALVASLLDGFSLALVIPFLRSLFGDSAFPTQGTQLEMWLDWMVGPLLRTDTPAEAIRNVVVLILAAMVIKNALSYLAGFLSAYVQEGMVRELRSRVFRHMQVQELSFFHQVRSGQLIARILSDAEHVKEMAGSLMTTVLQTVTLILVYIVILLTLSWQLTLIALALASAFPIVIRPVLGRLRRDAHNQAEKRGELASIVSEAVLGIRLIKAYGAEEHEAGRFDAAADEYRRQAIRTQSVALVAQPVSETFGAGLTVIMLGVGTTMALAVPGALPPAALVAFLVVALRLMSPLKKLAQLPALLTAALASVGRVFEILDRPRAEEDSPAARSVDSFRESIRFDRVSFTYSGAKLVLHEIDVEASRGEVVALVGASGAGKSTLVDLLPRFHDPTAGRVLIDGVLSTDLRRESVRRLFGIVSQETVLFHDTVCGNIAYGKKDADLDRVRAAAQAANAHDFIVSLPQGYDTVIGERGNRLSAGERQRLAIARALFRDSPILILDEATSNLDSESERLIQEALGRLFAGRTVFVIAHRLWTIRHASQILVLDEGRIVERGRHETLLEGGGVYARLYALQFGPSVVQVAQSA